MLWVEDISMVQDVLKKLERISSRLSENNNLLKAEVELKEKQAQTDEHMRIYDKITEEVAPHCRSWSRCSPSQRILLKQEKIWVLSV